MASVAFDPNADAVDLTGIGMPVAVPTALVTQVKNDTATVTADPHPRITRRADLMSGVLGERHLAGGPRPARAGRLALVQRVRPAQPGHPGEADHRPAHRATARRRRGPRRGRGGHRREPASRLPVARHGDRRPVAAGADRPGADGAPPAGRHGHRRRLGTSWPRPSTGPLVDAPDGVALAPNLDRVMVAPDPGRPALPVPRAGRPGSVPARRRNDPRGLGHRAQDQPAVRRVAPRRGQPRAQPRAALARLPDRPARHPVPPVLGPRQRRRHRPGPHLDAEQRPRRARPRRPRRPGRPARPRRAAAPVPQRQPVCVALGRRSPRREPAGAGGPAHPGVRRRARGGHHLRGVRPRRVRAAERRRLVLRHPGAGDRGAVRVRRAGRARPAAGPDLLVGGDLGAHRDRAGRLPADRGQPAGGDDASTACGSSTTPPTWLRSPTSSRCEWPSTPAAFRSWWSREPFGRRLRGARRRPGRRRARRAPAGPAGSAVRRRRAPGADLPGPDPPGHPRAGADRLRARPPERRTGVPASPPPIRTPGRRRLGWSCAARSSRRAPCGSSRP